MKRSEQVAQLIQPTIEAIGFDLWGVEYLPNGKFAILRIYINHQDGIKVEDCATVSHHVSGLLDVEDPIQSAYTLEVSSPGMDCPLFKVEQYQMFLGAELKLRLRLPVNKGRKWTGVLTEVKENSFILQPRSGSEIEVAFKNVDKATVVPNF